MESITNNVQVPAPAPAGNVKIKKRKSHNIGYYTKDVLDKPIFVNGETVSLNLVDSVNYLYSKVQEFTNLFSYRFYRACTEKMHAVGLKSFNALYSKKEQYLKEFNFLVTDTKFSSLSTCYNYFRRGEFLSIKGNLISNKLSVNEFNKVLSLFNECKSFKVISNLKKMKEITASDDAPSIMKSLLTEELHNKKNKGNDILRNIIEKDVVKLDKIIESKKNNKVITEKTVKFTEDQILDFLRRVNAGKKIIEAMKIIIKSES